MTENIVYPYNGGAIECAQAMDFTGIDQQTGQPRPVHLEDRIIVTYGRRKVTLNGAMVYALAHEYMENTQFAEWCKRCK